MVLVTAAYHDIIVLTAAWPSIEALRTQAPGGRTAALESTDPNHQGTYIKYLQVLPMYIKYLGLWASVVAEINTMGKMVEASML